MLQFGAPLADDSRVVIYDHNMFIVQATGFPKTENMKRPEPNLSEFGIRKKNIYLLSPIVGF